jgi:hypothetical protein
MESEKYNINLDIKPYLDDIADKLWSQPSHATIMVGAGFSKNASGDFPDWNELGDVFYKKIYGEVPTLKNTRYANVLKLADGVEAAFGRATLNKMLKTEIPDISVEPSGLHKDLLLLPWADVFTTNYDTLLERASNLVNSRRYDIVVNTEELIYSNSPRIVKLHGSFPSKTPFIISEEDYRTYPDDFAPFVNTVQQSLIENTLCLIGFSGDDPNFLNWIGWVRDNLGQKKAPKIYLVGLFSFTDAELKLLGKRNIVVVNMGLCGITDHWSAMNTFFKYLKAQDNQKNTLNWPPRLNISFPQKFNHKESFESQVTKITVKLGLLKQSYPGWVVAPYSARNKVWQHIQNLLSCISPEDDTSLKTKVLFVNELIWHIDICLFPISDNLAKLIEHILNELEKHDISNDEHDFSDKKQRNIIVLLKLALTRYYREEYRWDEWNRLITQLDKSLKSSSGDSCERLKYEHCLGCFFRLDFTLLKKQLDAWKPSAHFPMWELRKVGLLAELGDLEQAASLSHKVLLTIRDKLNLVPIKDDLSLLSEESFAMMMLRFINSANDVRSRNKFDDFNDRWQELALYKCDPWKEFEYLDLSLKHGYQKPQTEIRSPNFDIGSYQITNTEGEDVDAIKGYNLLRLYEQTGLPVKLQHTALNPKLVLKAVEAIVGYSPLWANFFAIRLSDSKGLNTPLGRKSLLTMQLPEIKQAANIYIDALKSLDEGLSEQKGRINKNFYDCLATVLPEALSRLISRLSFEDIKHIYTLVCRLFGSSFFFKYVGLENILKRVPKVINKEQAKQIINYALACRCPDILHQIDEEKAVPPVWHFDLAVLDDVEISSIDFQYLLSLVKDDKPFKQKWGVLTLAKLYKAGILTEQQSNLFGKALWNETNDGELPQYPALIASAYLYLPTPIDKSDVRTLVKSYVLSLEIPIRGDSKSYNGTRGQILFFMELFNCHENIALSPSELESLLDELIDWWDKDKHNLLDDKGPRLFGTTAEEFRDRFKQLVSALCYVVLPKLKIVDLDESKRGNIKRLISELDEYAFDTLRLKVAASGLLKNSEREIADVIIRGIISGNENSVIDACKALEYWLSIDSCDQQFQCISTLSAKVLMRNKAGLSYSLQTLHGFISKYPKQVTDKIISELVNSFLILKDETQLSSTEIESLIADNLVLRQKVCQLAFELYTSNTERQSADVNKLIVWKEVCDSENEFNEIKKIWA